MAVDRRTTSFANDRGFGRLFGQQTGSLIMADIDFDLKSFLTAYLNKQELSSRNIVFRFYQLEDCAYRHYSRDDWEMIFPGVTETEFNLWLGREDFVMLSTFERGSSEPFGLLCFEVSKTSNKRAYFHGGTWQHTMKDKLLAYEGIVFILHFLMSQGIDVLVTCLRSNTKANKFQESLGFVEFSNEGNLSYKYLDSERFWNNPIVNRFFNIEYHKN